MMPNDGPGPQAPIGPRLPLSGAAQAALRLAAERARDHGRKDVSPLDLVAALLTQSPPSSGPGAVGMPASRRPGMGSALAAVISAAAGAAHSAGADEVSVDDVLTAALAAAASPRTPRTPAVQPPPSAVDDHGEIVDHALRVLARREAVLLALQGATAGASASLLSSLARRLATADVPAALRDAEVVHVAGGPPLQSLGHRAAAQLRAMKPGATGVALIDDVLATATAPGGVDALLGALAAGTRLVAAADTEDLADLRQIPSLRRSVRSLAVEEPSRDELVRMLQFQAHAIGQHHCVQVPQAVPRAVVEFCARRRPGEPMSVSAVALLEDACALASMRGAVAVELADVGAAAGDHGATAEPVAQVKDLADHLRRRVVGQDRAVRVVADAILRAETGVRDPDRPLGSFLFLGPTGVGKTELARALTATLFGDESALVVLDMGEYQEPHSVARLVGAPPGYVGYAEGGHLTDPLRRRPYSVVLFDEIEKAHPDVLNTLLAVLDEGRLTDGYGRVVDARHAVLVLTSNLGGRVIGDPALAEDVIEHRVREAVVEHFPPEFLSRIDDAVVFRRLSEQDLAAIVDLQIARLCSRLEARDLRVDVRPEARAWLAAHVVDSPQGARPVRAAIRRGVEDVVARAVLDGRLQPGGGLALTVRAGAIVPNEIR